MKFGNQNLYVFGIFLCILMQSCFQTYYNRNDEKFKIPIQRTDFDQANPINIISNKFKEEEFIANYKSNDKIQYVNSEDIKGLVSKIGGNLVVVFYDPICIENMKESMKIANLLEMQNVQFIMISIVDNFKEINKTFDKKLKNQHYYVLPTFSKIGILDKKMNFTKQLCDDCYSKYKDEIIFTSVIHIRKNFKVVELNCINKVYEPDKIVEWIISNP